MTPLPAWVRPAPDGRGTLIDVRVVPGARRDEVAGVHAGRLKVRVSAPPEGGRANDAVRGLLAGVLGVRTSDVELILGHAHREKTLRVLGPSPDAVWARLREATGSLFA